MAAYEFKLTLIGVGDTEEEAWADAIDSFSQDPGEPNGELIEDFDAEDCYDAGC